MIDHTPLDVARLSPAAQKALGPGPARMMAARGMAPLPPVDQLTVLYQLMVEGDQGLAASANQTATKLPDTILAGALVNGQLDPRVIDKFAQLVGNRAPVFDALVQNPSIADETLAALAGRLGAREVDRIAANEQRMLRHPQIIAAMYMNKNARMSTVDRAVELAVRNNVRVPGLACWDEIARSLQGAQPAESSEGDALFAMAAEAVSGDDRELTQGDGEQVRDDDSHEQRENALLEQTKDLPIDKLSIPGKIRLATLGNGFHRAVLIRDPMRIVAMAAIKSPAVTEFEAKSYAGNQTLAEDVIRYIASRREWTKNIQVKKALCRNPKTPINDAAKLLPFLLEKDLNALARSKGVPSAVAAQARKLIMQRKGG
ncbi:MAG TPA: hypothetical protein VFS15_01655, partial [Kofleriaceae bacterium]|nr:hypothetical protein [Kofleriaceae bacterium]